MIPQPLRRACLAWLMPAMIITAPLLCRAQEPPPSPLGGEVIGDDKATRDTIDRQWTDLLDQRKAVNGPVAERVSRNMTLADEARDFYTNHPQDARAAEARSLEILALISAREDGDKGATARLQSAVSALRGGDFSPQAKSRGVAAYEFTEALRGAKDMRQRMDITTGVARAMIQEFPDAGEGYEALWAVARAEEGKAAADLARELLGARAPERIRQAAGNLIERQELPGQALASVLGEDHAEVLAALPTDEPVVVYAWSAQAPGSIALGQMLQARRFAAIGICLDEAVDESAKVAHQAGMGGRLLYDKQGSQGDVASRLSLDLPGQIYLTDSKGVIQEINGADLEAKFSRLGFVTRPLTPPAPYNPARSN